jgi:hypothetical protein
LGLYIAGHLSLLKPRLRSYKLLVKPRGELEIPDWRMNPLWEACWL